MQNKKHVFDKSRALKNLKKCKKLSSRSHYDNFKAFASELSAVSFSFPFSFQGFCKTPTIPTTHADSPLLMGNLTWWVFARHPPLYPPSYPPFSCFPISGKLLFSFIKKSSILLCGSRKKLYLCTCIPGRMPISGFKEVAGAYFRLYVATALNR